jgi:hypothetical protein
VLAIHKLRPVLRSQGNCRADRRGYRGLPKHDLCQSRLKKLGTPEKTNRELARLQPRTVT